MIRRHGLQYRRYPKLSLEPSLCTNSRAFFSINGHSDQSQTKLSKGTERQAGGRAGLELDFHFKITLIQIQEGFGGRDQKFHGTDLRGRSCVKRTPNMDVFVLGTWNTCNSGLMTRADKLCNCIVQRRFECLARSGHRILLYGSGGPRNPRQHRGRSRIGTYIPFLVFTHPIDRQCLVAHVSPKDPLHGRPHG